MRATYKHRRDCLVETLDRAGWTIPSPPGTMFAWVPLPPGFEQVGSLEFSKLLLEKAHVAVSPGLGFGEYGEGSVRLALVENEHRIRQAGREIKKFLSSADTLFTTSSPWLKPRPASVPSPNCRPFCSKLARRFGDKGTIAKTIV